MAKKLVRTTKTVWDNKTDKSEYNDSIVFIEDAEQIWSNDVYYNCSNSAINTGGVYPVVTVTDDFNIDVESNTFYNIKNPSDASIEINIKDQELFIENKSKHVLFSFDELETLLGNDDSRIIGMGMLFGAPILKNNSIPGYQYYSELKYEIPNYVSVILNIYYSDEIKTGNSVTALITKYIIITGTKITETELNTEMSISNIICYTENSDYLCNITYSESELSLSALHGFTEVENDNENYQYKYSIFGFLAHRLGYQQCYTNTQLPYTIDLYYNSMNLKDYVDDIQFIVNKDIKGGDIANEFVFNINSPAHIVFNQDIKWNNGNEPDLSQNGTYTISLLNGVGCYTFVE